MIAEECIQFPRESWRPDSLRIVRRRTFVSCRPLDWLLFDPEERCHRECARDGGQREQQAILPREKCQEYRGDDWADDRAGVIHRAMEAEDPASR